METLKAVWTAAKAKWDGLTANTKLLLVGAVAGTALLALWLA